MNKAKSIYLLLAGLLLSSCTVSSTPYSSNGSGGNSSNLANSSSSSEFTPPADLASLLALLKENIVGSSNYTISISRYYEDAVTDTIFEVDGDKMHKKVLQGDVVLSDTYYDEITYRYDYCYRYDVDGDSYTKTEISITEIPDITTKINEDPLYIAILRLGEYFTDNGYRIDLNERLAYMNNGFACWVVEDEKEASYILQNGIIDYDYKYRMTSFSYMGIENGYSLEGILGQVSYGETSITIPGSDIA